MKRGGSLGVAVIGSGRIGTLRARLAAKHPSVGFLAVSDLDADKARALAEQTDADLHSTNNFEMIERPEVNAVFVSTPEGEHAAPIIPALSWASPSSSRSRSRSNVATPTAFWRCSIARRGSSASVTAGASRNAFCAPRSR